VREEHGLLHIGNLVSDREDRRRETEIPENIYKRGGHNHTPSAEEVY
jgi:hypothetical protein